MSPMDLFVLNLPGMLEHDIEMNYMQEQEDHRRYVYKNITSININRTMLNP